MDNALSKPWSIGQKIIFRFLFIYFILYIFPFGIDILSIDKFWTPLIEWTGEHVFTLDYSVDVLPNGSGDTTWNYIQVFLMVSISMIVMIVWSVLDRGRSQYNTLLFWLTIVVRYYLAMVLIGYGFAKIFKTQFPFPYLERLIQPYGDSSPMGLLWTFMGYSTTYNIFTGFCEALGGFLLFFRRTKILGALINVTVLINIVLLNFAYDVPVKLFSLHLLFLTLFLLAPDAWRLLNFLVLNKPTSPEKITPIFNNHKGVIVHGITKAIFICFVLGYHFQNARYVKKQWDDAAPKQPLYGMYDVDLHIINQDTISPLPGSTKRLKKMRVSDSGFASLQYMDDAQIAYIFSADTLKHTIKLLGQDSSKVYQFKYLLKGDVYKLRGTAYGDSIQLTMKKINKKDFLLVNRGFHWINETPFNR